MANMLLRVMGAIAEFERQLIRERQREGIALAKKRGVYKGRPATLGADAVASLVKRLDSGERPSVVARDLGVSRMTLHRYRVRAGAQ